MRVHKPILTSRSLLGFWVTLLVIVSSCYCDEDLHKSSSSTAQVVGVAKCSDCTQSNLLSSHALSGLRVTIDCKVSDKEEFKTRGVGELDKQGKFKVTLPSEIIKDDGELKEECFAQLHSASNAPCPTHQGIEASKLILKSKDQQTGKHTFSPNGEISISPITCTSAFFWPHFKFPPLPKFPPHPWFKKDHPWFKKDHPWFKKDHPWFKKPIPKFKLPHFPPLMTFPPHPPKVFPPIYKHPIVSPPIYEPPPQVEPPVYKKPLPPPVPVYKPTPKVNPPPVYKKKPCPPPPSPVYKPTPKVNPPPVYKKPQPPPSPVYKPTPKVNPPPVYKKPLPPPTPIYTPHPPIPEIPPITKKPCPPLPSLPPFPKIPPKFFHPLPPLPKIPPKFFHHHHKFGKWPPIPPFSSHP